MVEQALAPREQRCAWAEELLEGAGASHLHVARGGVLALYAHARTTGLVVDMGWSGTTITPVADGFPFMMGAQYLGGVGAAAVDARLGGALAARGVGFAPASVQLSAGAAGMAVPSSSPSSAGQVLQLVSVPLLPYTQLIALCTLALPTSQATLGNLRHTLATVSSRPIEAGSPTAPQLAAHETPTAHGRAAAEAAGAVAVGGNVLGPSHGHLSLPDGTKVDISDEGYAAAELLLTGVPVSAHTRMPIDAPPAAQCAFSLQRAPPPSSRHWQTVQWQ